MNYDYSTWYGYAKMKKDKGEGKLKCTGADDVNVYLERWEDLQRKKLGVLRSRHLLI